MFCRVLGPLEVVDRGSPVALGGVRQRATLGFLLLNANRVQPTSALVEALWPCGEPPATSRKVVQNAVWGLRRTLGDDGGPALVTRPPGYMVSIDEDQLDLTVFRRRVVRGRRELADGDPHTAAETLRDALDLWRGPALADLVESGTSWPELAAAESLRLDAAEDYFEAELRCGRHRSALGALESVVDTEPLRERLCGQLMLALYRCGRQAQALSVYGRLRTRLVDDLGVEPSGQLQDLQVSILNHDADLRHARTPQQEGAVTITGSAPAPASAPAPDPGSASVDDPSPVPDPAPVTGSDDLRRGVPAAPDADPAPAADRRAEVSVVLVRARVPDPTDDPDDLDDARDDHTARVRALVETFDGTVVTSIGSTSFALFEPHGAASDHAERAVRAARVILADLHGDGPDGDLGVHVAVATGDARLRHAPGGAGARSVGGRCVTLCETLLSEVPAGEIQVCDRTRRATTTVMRYRSAGPAGDRWRLDRPGGAGAPPRPAAERAPEPGARHGVLAYVRHCPAPHLVTVLSDTASAPVAETGELLRRIPAESPDTVLLSHSAAVDGSAAGFVRGLLAQARVALHQENVYRLRREPGEPVDALCRALTTVARTRPVTLVVEDLHLADDALLDVVEHLHASSAPVLVIAHADPRLLRRRPGWGGGRGRSATITIDPAGVPARTPASAHAASAPARTAGAAPLRRSGRGARPGRSRPTGAIRAVGEVPVAAP